MPRVSELLRGNRPDKKTLVKELKETLFQCSKQPPSVAMAFGEAAKTTNEDVFNTYYSRHLAWERAHDRCCMFCHGLDHLESDWPYRRRP